jgi:hypothetical protein
VFTSHGSYASSQAFASGLIPAMWVGVAVLGAGALIAAVLPFSTRASAGAHAVAEAFDDQAQPDGVELAHAA